MTDDFTTPEWVKNAIFYQIFPDRFAKSDRLRIADGYEPWDSLPTRHGFKGGDLIGVLERLDYLQSLGINAIYFNPIFQSAANHRYHTHDYYQVDPLLGGNEAFQQLLSAAHRRGIRIILDGVFNHASRGFFPFNHLLECGEASPYRDWFIVQQYPVKAYQDEPNYECWWGLPALPKLNTANPRVREYIFNIARHWIETGIDGWRLDVPFEIDDDEFWQEFRQIVKTTNPEAYIVGEIPWEAQRWLRGDMFDGVMNYPFSQACLGFFGAHRINWSLEKDMMGFAKTKILDAQEFSERIEYLLHVYPIEATYAQLNLLDSHDMPRFLSLVSGDKDALKLAVLFQMTHPGAPCVYYGDEIGLDSDEDRSPELARKAFPWDEADWDGDLLATYQKCIAIRKSYPSLRVGTYTTLHNQDQILALVRQYQNEAILIVINNSPSNYALDLPLKDLACPNQPTVNLLNRDEASVYENKLLGTSLAPRTGGIFPMEIQTLPRQIRENQKIP